jgi:poly(A) polymerase/tRNA nucleotidyltransferase (CCA-adding enzyme)
MLIPKEVKFVIEELKKAGFEAYIVGGCVRDFLREVEPEDWDIATSAKPEEIQKVFPQSFYENKFLTVTVQTGSKNSRLKEIEITTYRSEAKYTDKRHPDEIRFAKTIEEDLGRRDFTVNAMALCLRLNVKQEEIVDPFGGRQDLKDKIIRAVGNPEERFSEDALRMMRAVRFAATLGGSAAGGWKIEEKTAEAIKKNAFWLQAISKERIRDEFLKIIMAERAADGIELLKQLGLLKYVVPELEEGYRVTQNKHHIYECYEHSLLSLKYAAQKNFNKYVRIAALFHDIAKPRVKQGEGPDATFYNHEILGAKMTVQILDRLKFPKKDIEKIVKLVRYHLFYYNVDEVSESSVRRLVREAGPENMEELLQVRMADRIGSGVPKAEPYKLRHLKYIIEKVSQDPISAKMLKVNGNEVMKILDIQAGPRVGQILDILLSFVLETPEKNEKKFLENEIKKMGKLSEKELQKLAEVAEKEREKIEQKRDEMTKKKYWVT